MFFPLNMNGEKLYNIENCVFSRKWIVMTVEVTTVIIETTQETTVIIGTAETTTIVTTGISVTIVTTTVEEWVVAEAEDTITLTTVVECAIK